jgi:hypothetical protein
MTSADISPRGRIFQKNNPCSPFNIRVLFNTGKKLITFTVSTGLGMYNFPTVSQNTVGSGSTTNDKEPNPGKVTDLSGSGSRT